MICPICKKSVIDDEAQRPSTYPFCSERCKLIDLGRWFDGKYAIPVSPEEEADAESGQPGAGLGDADHLNDKSS
ncbi:MAG TPA: DNA gyrase inhibitor YacG [Tepidisphaeraceae bacterium]|nr:DNA gyrase inhibitor YacG [Tepidisphaeraceae bacterium]